MTLYFKIIHLTQTALLSLISKLEVFLSEIPAAESQEREIKFEKNGFYKFFVPVFQKDINAEK